MSTFSQRFNWILTLHSAVTKSDFQLKKNTNWLQTNFTSESNRLCDLFKSKIERLLMHGAV